MKKYIKYILLILVIGLAFGFYQYNRTHQSLNNSSTDFKVNATQLFEEFEQNETLANQKYLDKIIEVSGVVSNVAVENNIERITLKSDNLMFGVICEIDLQSKDASKQYKNGDALTVKGKCTGMLTDVILVRCVVL